MQNDFEVVGFMVAFNWISLKLKNKQRRLAPFLLDVK